MPPWLPNRTVVRLLPPLLPGLTMPPHSIFTSLLPGKRSALFLPEKMPVPPGFGNPIQIAPGPFSPCIFRLNCKDPITSSENGETVVAGSNMGRILPGLCRTPGRARSSPSTLAEHFFARAIKFTRRIGKAACHTKPGFSETFMSDRMLAAPSAHRSLRCCTNSPMSWAPSRKTIPANLAQADHSGIPNWCYAIARRWRRLARSAPS